MTIHLAILDADIPIRPHYLRNGLYSTQYRSIIAPAVDRLSCSSLHPGPIKLVVSSWDVVGGVYPPEEILSSTAVSNDTTTTTTTTITTNNESSNKNSNSNNSTKITALLITGSSSSVYQTATNPWIPPLITFIRRVYTHHPHVKLLGGCFGHQLIAAALLPEHTRVEKCPSGPEVGVHAVQLAPRFERTFEPVLKGRGKKGLRMQMMHGDWVIPLSEFTAVDDTSSSSSSTAAAGGTPANPAPTPTPTPTNTGNSQNSKSTISIRPPWLNIGSTPHCPIQGLYLPNRVLTFQGHFEIDSGGMSLVAGEFGPSLGWSAETQRVHQERIAWEGGRDDGDVVADVIALFLVGETALLAKL